MTPTPTPTPIPIEASLEDKAALLSGRDFWSTHPLPVAGAPSVVLTDGPHGVRRQAEEFAHVGLQQQLPATCFPPAVAVGSSWDRSVAAQVGAAVGREARALGVHVVLGPGVNMKRSPLCGRNFEYYSEDPLLAGALGAAHVSAQQEQGVGASVKHFAANNQETDRMRVSAEVDERTLREIYLPAFEHVIKQSQPATVMCAYNRVNGVYASQNPWLLRQLLRNEWGFEGVVVSDWGAVQDPVAAVRAGLDLEMPGNGGVSAQKIVDAVRNGTLDEAVVDEAVERVLALSRFVEPAVAPVAGAPVDRGAVDQDAHHHHQLARGLAADCAVLLKNDGDTLPLAGSARLAVVGELARTPRFQGGGSSRVTATRVDVPLEAICLLAEQTGGSCTFAPGYSLDGSASEAELLEPAAAAARDADVTIVFAGPTDQEESEGFDRESLELPAAQLAVIRAVADVSRRTVVVLANGGVISLEGWHDRVDAILEGFLLGQAGGGAVADLLSGVTNPSGRLAETIPMRLADNPSYVNFPGEQGHVRYGEGVMIGYRWYTTTGRPVRYAFGHGLSYTTFATSGLAVDVVGDDSARVTLTVTNTGARAGKHVVQVYVATDAGPVRRPSRELRAFEKLSLEPQESRTVGLDLDRRAFAYYDVGKGDWVVPGGTYAIQIGDDATTVVAERSVTLPGDVVVRELTLDSSLGDWMSHPVVGPALLGQLGSGEGISAFLTNDDLLRSVASMPMRKAAELAGPMLPTTALDDLIRLSRAAR